MKFNVGDIVLCKSTAGDAIPSIHVKLLNRRHVKGSKGNTIDWPEYIVWDAELVYPREAKMLKKEWSIPFSFPDNIETVVFESSIIKIVKKNKLKKKK